MISQFIWSITAMILLLPYQIVSVECRCSNGPYYYNSQCNGGGEGIGSSFYQHLIAPITYSLENDLKLISNPECFHSSDHHTNLVRVFGLDEDCSFGDLVDTVVLEKATTNNNFSYVSSFGRIHQMYNESQKQEMVHVMAKYGFTQEQCERALKVAEGWSTWRLKFDLAMTYLMLHYHPMPQELSYYQDKQLSDLGQALPIKIQCDDDVNSCKSLMHPHLLNNTVFMSDVKIRGYPAKNTLRRYIADNFWSVFYRDQRDEHQEDGMATTTRNAPFCLNDHIITVAIHFRWGDVKTSNADEPDGRALPLHKVLKLMEFVNKSRIIQQNALDIKLFAQDGSKEQFDDFFKAYPTAQLMNGNYSMDPSYNLIYDIDRMVTSDIFIGSISNFAEVISLIKITGMNVYGVRDHSNMWVQREIDNIMFPLESVQTSAATDAASANHGDWKESLKTLDARLCNPSQIFCFRNFEGCKNKFSV